MKNMFIHRSFRDKASRFRSALIPGFLLALVLVPLTSYAQVSSPVETTTTTGVVANAAQQVEPSKSVVRGRVVYDDTNRPVRRTRVMLLDMGKSGRERGGITNGSGEFQIKEVPAGTYVVMVDATGVITPMSLVDIEDKSEKFNFDEMKKYFDEVVVDGNRDVTIKVRAKRGGAISGKVTYSDGDPAINVRVTIMRKKDGRLMHFVTNVNPSSIFGTYTDDRGMYRVTGLAPGDYIVSASEVVDHDGENASLSNSMMDMFGGNSLVVTYYKDAVKANDASAVRIDPGQDMNEVNITLADRVLHTISGTVVARDLSSPLVGARITITGKDNANAVSTLLTPTTVGTDVEGRFTFGDMPDGIYNLKVDPPYDSNNDTGEASEASPSSSPSSAPTAIKKLAPKEQEVTVSGNDVTDLTIKLTAGARVSGKVTVESGHAVPQNTTVQLLTTTQEPIAEGGRIEADGAFVIDGVPSGVFYAGVRLNQESDFYLKAIAVNGVDLTSDPLVIGEGTDVNDMRVIISGDGATLSGRILLEDNTPVAGVVFVLIPSDQRKWRARSSYLFGASEHGGSYSVNGAPGDYLIIFLRGVDQALAVNESWIRDRSTTARRVTLLPNERKNMDLIVPR